MSNAQWNYEPCTAILGTVVVGKCLLETFWHNGLEGQRRKVVRIEHKGETFFIDNQDGEGSRKVAAGGGPWSSHKDVPVDDPATFVAD